MLGLFSLAALLVTTTLASPTGLCDTCLFADSVLPTRDDTQMGTIMSPVDSVVYKTCGGLFNITIVDVPDNVAVATAVLTPVNSDKTASSIPFGPGDLFLPYPKNTIQSNVGIPNDPADGSGATVVMTGNWTFSVSYVTFDCSTGLSDTARGPSVPIQIQDEGYDDSQCS